MERDREFEPQTSAAEPFFTGDNLPWGWRERSVDIAKDERKCRLDLSAGVLRDEEGRIPVFSAVVEASRRIPKGERVYLPPAGLPEFREAVPRLLFPAAPYDKSRLCTVQTIGAAGALRLAADCVMRLGLAREIFVSSESWADHRRIFERAGLAVRPYPYLSASGRRVDTPQLLSAISAMPRRALMLLQASCHNPTGYDPDAAAWEEIIARAAEKRLLPLFDVAYPGLGSGLRADLLPLAACLEKGLDFLAATSCGKAFGLYDGRVGALTAVVSDSGVRERLESQIKIDIQASYSSPPRQDAAVIAEILTDETLAAQWRAELEGLRESVRRRRHALAERLADLGAPEQLLRIKEQLGIFGWTSLGRGACRRLADEFAIYVPSNGRVCIGAMPASRIDDVAFSLLEASRH